MTIKTFTIYIYLVERLLAGDAFKVLFVFPRRGLVTRGFLTRAAEPLVSRQLGRGGGLDAATIAPQPGVWGGWYLGARYIYSGPLGFSLNLHT